MRYEEPHVSEDRLRAGDADRDRVADRLRKAHADGRLDSEELDERIERCLRARTFGELQRLTADLHTPARGRELSLAPVGRRSGVRIVLAAIAVLWVLAAAAHGHAHAGGVLLAIAFVFLVTRLVRAVRA
jgi:hypothetical protein